jgi:hypothetical protein
VRQRVDAPACTTSTSAAGAPASVTRTVTSNGAAAALSWP